MVYCMPPTLPPKIILKYFYILLFALKKSDTVKMIIGMIRKIWGGILFEEN